MGGAIDSYVSFEAVVGVPWAAESYHSMCFPIAPRMDSTPGASSFRADKKKGCKKAKCKKWKGGSCKCGRE